MKPVFIECTYKEDAIQINIFEIVSIKPFKAHCAILVTTGAIYNVQQTVEEIKNLIASAE